MDSSGEPMDWDYNSPQLHLPRQPPSIIDWEPEIPGQFHTPTRLRRKRNAEAAGFATDGSNAFKSPAQFTSQEPLHNHDAPIMFITALLIKTFWIIESFITLPIFGYKLTRSGGKLAFKGLIQIEKSKLMAPAAAASRQVIEIRQYTVDGYHSIKRRATNITRPVTHTAQHILRRGRAVQRAGATKPADRRSQPLRTTPQRIDRHTDEAHTSQIHRAEAHIPEAQITDPDRFSNHPIEAPEMSHEHNELLEQGQEELEQKPIQVTLDRRRQAEVRVHDSRTAYIRGLDQSDPVIDPVVEAKALAAIRRSLVPNALPHDIPVAQKKQQAPQGKFHRPSGYLTAKDQLPYHQITPDAQQAQIEAVYEQPTSLEFSDKNEQVQKNSVEAQQESTAEIAAEDPIPIERRVRIALDPWSGRVQETFGKFFKNSLVGEWAPPSPWATKQVKNTQMDLNGQLESLMDYPTSVGTTEDLPGQTQMGGFKLGTTTQTSVDGDLSTAPRVLRSSHGTPKEAEGDGPELEDIFPQLALSEEAEEKRAIKWQLQQTIAAQKVAEREAAAKAQAEADEAALKGKYRRRIPSRKFIQPLSGDWEARIEESMSKGDQVPLTTTVTGTELRRKDFLTVLGEREWLNDEIINAYLEWVTEFANDRASKNDRSTIPKVIALNSFFYKKIASDGPKSVARWMKRKKADGKKLLEVERVLIPVNCAAHWTLIVVSPVERTVEYLDSFAGPPRVFIDNTLRWLEAELGPAFRREEWNVLETSSAVQKNGYDCGVFAVTNAECVTGSLDTTSYSASDMAAQRRRIAAVLLNRGFGGELVAGQEM